VTLRSTFRVGRQPFGPPIREVLIRDSEEHVEFRASALGLPDWEVLLRDSEEHVALRALALWTPQ
jgi:hypothetical protein